MILIQLLKQQMRRKLFIIVKIIANNRLLIIVLIVGKIFVLNVLFMVKLILISGNHKDHNVRMIKKAIS